VSRLLCWVVAQLLCWVVVQLCIGNASFEVLAELCWVYNVYNFSTGNALFEVLAGLCLVVAVEVRERQRGPWVSSWK